MSSGDDRGVPAAEGPRDRALVDGTERRGGGGSGRQGLALLLYPNDGMHGQRHQHQRRRQDEHFFYFYSLITVFLKSDGDELGFH